MPTTLQPPVPEAPESSLPRLLVEPPWARAAQEPGGREPVVLKLKAPKDPPTMTWAPGRREEWLEAPYTGTLCVFERLPDDTDWEGLAETFFSGKALEELDKRERWRSALALFMQAPLEIGERLLADQRYWDDFGEYGTSEILEAAAARHGLAAYSLAVHAAKNNRVFNWLDPYLGTDVAQLMVNHFGKYPNGDRAQIWFTLHGSAAARLAVPDALRKPGPKRERAEEALRLVAQEHGHEAIVEAARFYGDEAAEAIAALRTDPLDLYPDPFPPFPEFFDPANLPQLLLKGRELALPASATRHFIMMLLISTSRYEPYPGVPQVVGLFDPDSLADFAYELFVADRTPRQWAPPGVQYLLIQHGNDAVADRLVPHVARWDKGWVWDIGGQYALQVFIRLGTDSALRHLHHLSQKARDQKRIRPAARRTLDRAAQERGLTTEQLADRLVPVLGLDATGGLTLDYGRRTFRVGFDEQLKPFVTDADGKVRRTLPKPGVKDDPALAPAAHKRFADLKKQVRTIAADQLKRLERAMVTGRAWTSDDFRSLFIEHPLLWHIARRLVWNAEAAGITTHFRIAEDRTLATVQDDAFTLPGDARVTLPHPLLLDDDALKAWSQVFADYEILQPFRQLGRAVHALTEEEMKASDLERFHGRTVHFGRILGMTSRGWELGEKEDGGFRRQIMYMTPDDRHVMVFLDPGIRVIAPEEFPDQAIRNVVMFTGRYSGTRHPFGELDTVTASELLDDLTHLAGPGDRVP